MNHNCPGIKKKKKSQLWVIKKLSTFQKYIYLLLLIAYSDLKEADTDCDSQWQKRTELQNPLLVITIWNGRIKTLKQILSPSAANIAEKVLQKIKLC